MELFKSRRHTAVSSPTAFFAGLSGDLIVAKALMLNFLECNYVRLVPILGELVAFSEFDIRQPLTAPLL